jgi:alkylation response protein AidB-like acyl-CoA dehydrogenase
MNLHLSDDQNLLKESFERFFQTESSIARVRAAEPLGFDRALWDGLLEIGALTMRAPAHAGGGDLSLFDAALLMDQAGRTLASAPIVEGVVVARLLASIDHPVARAWWKSFSGGKKIVMPALHDVAARPAQVIPGGAVADAVIGLDGDRLILVTATRPPVSPPNLGASPITTWALAGPQPSGERHELARGKPARAAFAAALEEWKLLTAATLAAIALRALEMAAAYSRERSQFGKPIGTYQGISHPLANLVTDAEGAQLLTWRAIWNVAHDTPDVAATISMAYWWAADTAGRAVAQSLHTFGGYGLSLEYDIQLYHRRAKSMALVWGDPQDELNRVGERLWKNISPAALPETGEIGIDFGYGERADKLAAETHAFFERVLTPELRKRSHHSFDGHDWGVHRAAGVQRLLYPTWPTRFGGRDADPYEAVASAHVWDEHDWTINAVAVSNMVGWIIMEYGSVELQQKVLPRMSAGEVVCSLGYTEPGSGSDVFAAKTRAVRDGDTWIINGQKMFTSGANLAQYVMLLTRTDPDAPKHRGITLFLVPLDSPGIEIQPVHTYPDERTNITFYSEVRVPDLYRLGAVNGGLEAMTVALKLEQGGAGFIIPHRRALRRAVEWARTATRYGHPALDDPQVLGRLSRVAVHSEVSDAIFRRSLWARANDVPDRAFGPMSKLFSTEVFLRDSTDLLDLAAPESLFKGQEGLGLVERSHRHAAATTIYGGTSEIQRSLIAEKALGLPRSR